MINKKPIIQHQNNIFQCPADDCQNSNNTVNKCSFKSNSPSGTFRTPHLPHPPQKTPPLSRFSSEAASYRSPTPSAASSERPLKTFNSHKTKDLNESRAPRRKCAHVAVNYNKTNNFFGIPREQKELDSAQLGLISAPTSIRPAQTHGERFPGGEAATCTQMNLFEH